MGLVTHLLIAREGPQELRQMMADPQQGWGKGPIELRVLIR